MMVRITRELIEQLQLTQEQLIVLLTNEQLQLTREGMPSFANEDPVVTAARSLERQAKDLGHYTAIQVTKRPKRDTSSASLDMKTLPSSASLDMKTVLAFVESTKGQGASLSELGEYVKQNLPNVLKQRAEPSTYLAGIMDRAVKKGILKRSGKRGSYRYRLPSAK
jgi:hypothetical protein